LLVRALAALGAIAHGRRTEAPPVRESKKYRPRRQGRIDHFTIDAKRKRVIFSGLGNNSVQTWSVRRRMIHQIADCRAAGSSTCGMGQAFVANSADGT